MLIVQRSSDSNLKILIIINFEKIQKTFLTQSNVNFSEDKFNDGGIL